MRESKQTTFGYQRLNIHNNVLQKGKNNGKINIGNFVITGPNVIPFAFSRDTELSNIPMIEQDYWDGDIIIEDDVWIGLVSH